MFNMVAVKHIQKTGTDRTKPHGGNRPPKYLQKTTITSLGVVPTIKSGFNLSCQFVV